MKRPFLLPAEVAFLLFFFLTGAGTAEAPSFADVVPILNKTCVPCHSGAKPPDGLRLDSYENSLRGGKNGPVVIPGTPEESEIVKRITGKSKPRMPMQGSKLPDGDIQKIRTWIAAGAPR